MNQPSDPSLRLHRLVLMLWRVIGHVQRVRLSILFVVMLISAAFELGSLAGIQIYFSFVASGELSASIPGIDLIADMTRRGQILVLSVGLGLVLLVKLLVGLWTNLMLARTVTQQQLDLAARLFRAYQFAPYTWYGGRNTSDLQRNLMQDVALVANQIALPLLQLVLNGVISIAVLVFILLTLSPTLLLSIGLIIVLLTLVGMSVQKMLVEAGRLSRLATGDTLRATYEGMNAMTEARILGRHDAFIARFERVQKQLGWALLRRIFLTQSLPMVLESLIMIAFITIVSFLVISADAIEAAFATAAVLAMAIFRLRQVLNKVLGAINKIGSASSSLPPLVADLKLLEPLSGDVPPRVPPPEKRAEVVQFDEVRFNFPKQEASALAGVSTELRRGEHLAIMGASGAGKSTFLLLLLGLVRPTAGQIRIDGRPLEDCLPEWNAQIGYVPQSVFLVDDTIAANVAFGIPENERNLERIRRVLEQVQLLDFVNSLPDGLETSVEERGSALSGGQRQRIGLARALYREPSVIILDEATSALDRNTQAKVMQALEDLPQNPTVISVTHHLEPLQYADRLILFEAGKIVSDGSVDEVCRTDAFQRIARSGEVEGAA